MPLGNQPPGLPVRQHAWAQWLHKDEYGNPLAPRFDRLLFFNVRGRPTSAYLALLESRLRTLERTSGGAPRDCCSPSAMAPSTSPVYLV